MGKEQQQRRDDDTHQAAYTISAANIYIRIAEVWFPKLLTKAYQQEVKELSVGCDAIAKTAELSQVFSEGAIAGELPTKQSELPLPDSAFLHLSVYDTLFPDDEGTRGILPICLRPYLLKRLEDFLNACSTDGKPWFLDSQKKYWRHRLTGCEDLTKQALALYTANVYLHRLLTPPTKEGEVWCIDPTQALEQEREVRRRMLQGWNITGWDKVTRTIPSVDEHNQTTLRADARIFSLLDCFILVLEVLSERGEEDGLYGLMQVMYRDETQICHTRDRHQIVGLVAPFDGLSLSVNETDLRQQLQYQFVFQVLKAHLGLTTPAEEARQRQGLALLDEKATDAGETQEKLYFAEDTEAFDFAFRNYFLPWIRTQAMPDGETAAEHNLLRLFIPAGKELATELKTKVDLEFIRLWGKPDKHGAYDKETISAMACEFSPLLTELQRWFMQHAKIYCSRDDRWQGPMSPLQMLALTVIHWLEREFRPSGLIHSGVDSSSTSAPPAVSLSMKEGFYLISRVFDVFAKCDALEASYFSVLLAYDESESQAYAQAKAWVDAVLEEQNLISRLQSPEGYQALLTHVTVLERFYTRMNTEGLEALLSTFLTDWQKANEEPNKNHTFEQHSRLFMAMAKLVYADELQKNERQWVFFLTNEKIQHYNEINSTGDKSYEASVSWITRVILVALNRDPKEWTPIFFTEVTKVMEGIKNDFQQPGLDPKDAGLKRETRVHAYPPELIAQLEWVMAQYKGPKEVLVDMTEGGASSSSLPEAAAVSQSQLTSTKTPRPPLYLLTPALFSVEDSYLLNSYFCYAQGHDTTLIAWLLNPKRGANERLDEKRLALKRAFNPNGRYPLAYRGFFGELTTPLRLARFFRKATLLNHLESMGANDHGTTPLHLAAMGTLAGDIPDYAWDYLEEENRLGFRPLTIAIITKNKAFIAKYKQKNSNWKHDMFYYIPRSIAYGVTPEDNKELIGLINKSILSQKQIDELLGIVIKNNFIEIIYHGHSNTHNPWANIIKKRLKEISQPYINLLLKKRRNIEDAEVSAFKHPLFIAFFCIKTYKIDKNETNKGSVIEILQSLWSDDVINQKDGCGNTILHVIIENVNYVELLGKFKNDDLMGLLNVPNALGLTPLELLAKPNQPKIINDLFFKICCLINKHLNFMTQLDDSKKTMLLSKVCLLRREIPEDMSNKMTAFIQHSCFKYTLVECDSNAMTQHLFSAIQCKDWVLVKKLLNNNSKNLRDLHGNTVLHRLIIERAPSECFDQLTDDDLASHVNERNLAGYTPLHQLAVDFHKPRCEQLFYRLCRLPNIDFTLRVQPDTSRKDSGFIGDTSLAQPCRFYDYRAVDIALSTYFGHGKREISDSAEISFYRKNHSYHMAYLLICYMFLKDTQGKIEPLFFSKELLNNKSELLARMIKLSQNLNILSIKELSINSLVPYHKDDVYLYEANEERILPEITKLTTLVFIIKSGNYVNIEVTDLFYLLVSLGAKADVADEDTFFINNEASDFYYMLLNYTYYVTHHTGSDLPAFRPLLTERFSAAVLPTDLNYGRLIAAIQSHHDSKLQEEILELEQICKSPWFNPDLAHERKTPLMYALTKSPVDDNAILMLAQRSSVAWADNTGMSALSIAYTQKPKLFGKLLELAITQKCCHPATSPELKALLPELIDYLNELQMKSDLWFTPSVQERKSSKTRCALLLLNMLLTTDEASLGWIAKTLTDEDSKSFNDSGSRLKGLYQKACEILGYEPKSKFASVDLRDDTMDGYHAITATHVTTSPFYRPAQPELAALTAAASSLVVSSSHSETAGAASGCTPSSADDGPSSRGSGSATSSSSGSASIGTYGEASCSGPESAPVPKVGYTMWTSGATSSASSSSASQTDVEVTARTPR